MTKLVNLVKTLNVTNRKAFKALLNEWIQNKTLDDDCIMLLWAWFTKTATVSNEDRIAGTLLISLLARYKNLLNLNNIFNEHIKLIFSSYSMYAIKQLFFST